MLATREADSTQVIGMEIVAASSTNIAGTANTIETAIATATTTTKLVPQTSIWRLGIFSSF
jgi:hypothetical protein